jgi:hypothetical protein
VSMWSSVSDSSAVRGPQACVSLLPRRPGASFSGSVDSDPCASGSCCSQADCPADFLLAGSASSAAGRVLDRRANLEFALRRSLIVAREHELEEHELRKRRLRGG